MQTPRMSLFLRERRSQMNKFRNSGSNSEAPDLTPVLTVAGRPPNRNRGGRRLAGKCHPARPCPGSDRTGIIVRRPPRPCRTRCDAFVLAEEPGRRGGGGMLYHAPHWYCLVSELLPVSHTPRAARPPAVC